MNRVFALTIVMSASVYAASPTPEKSPTYSEIFSKNFRNICDKIDLDSETCDSLPVKVRHYLTQFHYIYAEMEKRDADTVVTAVLKHLQDKWWETHSWTKRAGK